MTCLSEDHEKMYTKESDAGTQAECGLRPKAYNTKKTLGHRYKTACKHQLASATVKICKALDGLEGFGGFRNAFGSFWKL